MDAVFVKRYVPSAIARFNRIHELFKPAKKGLVLDIGCSIGLLTNDMKPRASRIVGVDIDKDMVRAAQRLFGKDCLFVVGDSMRLPFKDGVFDGAVSSEVIEHVDKPDAYAREAARVLKKNAMFVLTTPNGEIGKPFIGRVPAISLIWLAALMTGNEKFIYPYGHYYGGLTPKTLPAVLEKSGFRKDRLEYCGYMLTKIMDDCLYIAAVGAGKTKESTWTEGGGTFVKIFAVFVPLIKFLVWIDSLVLKTGIQGYIMTARFIKK